MNEIYLICDESGSKGFSDNDEQFDGDFGLFAGYFLNKSNIQQMKIEFEKISGKYANNEGKLHITDLDATIQEELRNEVFDIIMKNDIPCVYEAISVKGFKAASDILSEIKNKTINELADQYSFSKNINRERLHSELFQGIFGKSIAYFIDYYSTDTYIKISVIVDNIEETLKKEFESKANEIVNPFPSTTEIKAFDKNLKQPIAKSIHFTSKEVMNDGISKTEFEIKIEDSSLTLIADILANSIYYYVKKELSTNPNINLNAGETIKRHPLAKLIYGASSQNNVNVVSDIIFGRVNI